MNESGTYMYGNNYDLVNDETGNFIVQYANETDIILGGSENSAGNGGYDVETIKISEWGFGSNFSNDGTGGDDISEHADTTADYGIVIVGTTGGTVNGIKSAFVMKTDANLNTEINISEVFDITSISNSDTKPEASLYPNPASEIISIKEMENSGNKAFTIYNVLGEAVFKGNSIGNNINIRHLNNGVYFIAFPEESNGLFKFTKI